MITCKEDLFNTYVDGSDKEISKLYQETAFKFGFDWLHFGDKNVRHDVRSPIICCHEYLKVSWEKRGSDAFSVFKRLTLSDLKPRAKVEYEQVTDSIFDLKDEFERGELFCNLNNVCDYSKVVNTSTLSLALEGGFLYRRIERPVEWWEDVAKFVGENACNMSTIARNIADDSLYVEAKMTRDQWCDFARILLEKEGD